MLVAHKYSIRQHAGRAVSGIQKGEASAGDRHTATRLADAPGRFARRWVVVLRRNVLGRLHVLGLSPSHLLVLAGGAAREKVLFFCAEAGRLHAL